MTIPSRSRRAVVRLLLVMAATGASLLIAELLLRAFGVAGDGAVVQLVGVDRAAAFTTWDPDLLWRLAPKGGYDRIDEIGVRGDAFTAPRDGRDLRILCVGDSCAYGLLVLRHESFGGVLDRRLQARLPAANVETVIAACPGYSTYQNLAMCRRHAERFSPDVTVLYVGAWNDMAAVGTYTDAEYGAASDLLARHPFWSLRIGRLLWRATHAPPTVEEAKRRLETAYLPGSNCKVRVTLEELRSNVRELIALARKTGVVAAILPSMRNETRGLPWTHAYRLALIEVYRELDVPYVDSDVVFEAYAARHPGLKTDGIHFLSDTVHPTAIGHAALGEALEPVVAGLAGARLRALERADPLVGAQIASVDPATLPPGRRARLRIHGAGFRGYAPPLRVLVNGQSASFRIVDDSTIEVDAEPEFLCRPGPLVVTLRTRAGLRTAPRTPEVLPWTVRVTVAKHEDKRVVRACADCDGGLSVVVFVSPALLEKARETRWGPFRLKDPRRDHPDSAFEDPMGLLGLKLPMGMTMRFESESRPVCADVTMPPDLGTSPALFAQVQIRWGLTPESAWLSDVIAVEEER